MGAYLAIGQWITANWREAAILIFGGAVLARELAFFFRERRRSRGPVELQLASGPHQGAIDLSTYAKATDLARVEASLTALKIDVNDALRVASDAMFVSGQVEERVKELKADFREERAERRGDSQKILNAIEGKFSK